LHRFAQGYANAGMGSSSSSSMSMGMSASIVIEPFVDPSNPTSVTVDNFIGGSGNGNTNYIVDTAGGVMLGLKSKNRYYGEWCPATIDSGRAVYVAAAGLGEFPAGVTSSAADGLTKWSYDYVFDVGTNDVSNYGLRIRFDFDPAYGNVPNNKWYQVESPLTPISGSTTQGGESWTMGWNNFGLVPADGTYSGLTFSGSANYMDIDPNAAGRYDVEVEIFELNGGNVVVSAAMYVLVVDVVPDCPTTTTTNTPAVGDPPLDDGKKAKSTKKVGSAMFSALKGTASASVVAAVCGVVVVVAFAVLVTVKRSRRARAAQEVQVKDFEAHGFEQCDDV